MRLVVKKVDFGLKETVAFFRTDIKAVSRRKLEERLADIQRQIPELSSLESSLASLQARKVRTAIEGNQLLNIIIVLCKIMEPVGSGRFFGSCGICGAPGALVLLVQRLELRHIFLY